MCALQLSTFFITLAGGPSMLSSKDTEYKLAQSGDATCNGLDSAEVKSNKSEIKATPLNSPFSLPPLRPSFSAGWLANNVAAETAGG